MGSESIDLNHQSQEGAQERVETTRLGAPLVSQVPLALLNSIGASILKPPVLIGFPELGDTMLRWLLVAPGACLPSLRVVS